MMDQALDEIDISGPFTRSGHYSKKDFALKRLKIPR